MPPRVGRTRTGVRSVAKAPVGTGQPRRTDARRVRATRYRPFAGRDVIALADGRHDADARAHGGSTPQVELQACGINSSAFHHMILTPPRFAGPTPPALLDWLAQHARAAALGLSSSPVYADAWWDAEHREFGRSPRAEAASGWNGLDRVVRYVNRMGTGSL